MAEIVVEIRDPGLLIGKKRLSIELQVDLEGVAWPGLGEEARIDIPPGPHKVRIVLKGGFMFARKSPPVTVDGDAGTPARLIAKYSRMWGRYELRPA